jgi:hypothetical protein
MDVSYFKAKRKPDQSIKSVMRKNSVSVPYLMIAFVFSATRIWCGYFVVLVFFYVKFFDAQSVNRGVVKI